MQISQAVAACFERYRHETADSFKYEPPSVLQIPLNPSAWHPDSTTKHTTHALEVPTKYAKPRNARAHCMQLIFMNSISSSGAIAYSHTRASASTTPNSADTATRSDAAAPPEGGGGGGRCEGAGDGGT